MNKRIKNLSTKALSFILIGILICTSVIGGTVAWLVDKTDEVTNTFTYGDVNIDLDETDTGKDGDGDDTTNEYEMMPGETIIKDPKPTTMSWA